MRKHLGSAIVVAAVAASVAAVSSAKAGTYIPVPMVPGAASEIVFSINNSNVVAGSFRDSNNVEHGFFGPMDGSDWTIFDVPGKGVTGTEPRYIGDNGAIDGFATAPRFTVGEEFYRTPSGRFKFLAVNGKRLDGVAQGINSSQTNVGDYLRGGGEKIAGYFGRNGKYRRDFNMHRRGSKHFLQIGPRGITDFFTFGIAYYTVGLFVDQNGLQSAFYQENRADALPFDYPGAEATALEDINDSFVATGQWTDSDGNPHAFTVGFDEVRDRIVDLDPRDGSTYQQAWGINDRGERNRRGLVALSTNTGRSYIYCPSRNPERCPSGGFTVRDHTIEIPIQSLPHYERHGRIAHGSAIRLKKRGAIQ